MLAMLLPALAAAHDFEVDGIYYNITSDNEVEVTNRSDVKYSGDVVIPSTVTYQGTTYSVTTIGYGAFKYCDGLTGVNIGNSVTSIKMAAFYSCTGLTSINLPNSVTSIGNSAFSYCTGLTSINIPNSVTSIDNYAFSDCTGLKSFLIGSSLASIGFRPFDNCTGLKTIIVDSGNPNYDSRDNCNALIETASNTLLVGCQNTIIPNSVTSIGNFAFFCCSSLTDLIIPNSVTSIGECAFGYCSGLTDLIIPNSVTSIGVYAFQGCSGLTSIIVEDGNPNYDSRDNCNALIETTSNTLLAGCQNTIIPNTVTSIGNYAFYECFGLTSVDIPNSVTSIDYYAFGKCTGLDDVFCHIVDPSQVSLGYCVFYLDGDNYSGRTLHVPAGTLAAYQGDANWYPYFGSIVEIAAVSGDVDGDGNVTIGDVTNLIDKLLGGGVSVADYPAADVDGDGNITIGDVTSIIDMLLSGN